MSVEEAKDRIDSTKKEDEIDFSDLEAKYKYKTNFDEYILIDGAPIAPESKLPIFKKVLVKFLRSAAEVEVNDDTFYIPLKDNFTTGRLIVKCKTANDAKLASLHLNQKRLDKNYRLTIIHLGTFEHEYKELSEMGEPDEVVIPDFMENLRTKSWLLDKHGRDQIGLHFSETFCVYWNKRLGKPEPVIEPRKAFTSKYAKFSSLGNYLFSIHPQGVQSWGGEKFTSVLKFIHSQVRLIDFSPNENYMVTLSPVPITRPSNIFSKTKFPFGPESENHKLVIWNLITGDPIKTFPLPASLENQRELPWPFVKWSWDDKYFARQCSDSLCIYDTANFQMIDKKPIKIEGLVDFDWAPAGVKLYSTKSADLSYILSYWTPEFNNQIARVSLMEVPSKKILRTLNLFHVTSCRMYWQNEGKYLCVKINLRTKSGKTTYSNLEFFKLNEKNIPVEKIELKEIVLNFAWEPYTDRFITITRLDDGNNNPAFPKNNVSFYHTESTNKNNVEITNYKISKQISNKHSNVILWSPKGKYVIVATILKNQGDIDFYDVLFENDKSYKKNTLNVKFLRNEKYSAMTNVAWDLSGRFLAAWSSVWLHNIDNGFKLFLFTGEVLLDNPIEQFKEFIWRPRPPSLLTEQDKKKIKQHSREYSLQFEEIDAMEADDAVRAAVLTRRKLLEEWRKYREKYANTEIKTNMTQVEIIEEIKEEIIEEKEEIIEEK